MYPKKKKNCLNFVCDSACHEILKLFTEVIIYIYINIIYIYIQNSDIATFNTLLNLFSKTHPDACKACWEMAMTLELQFVPKKITHVVPTQLD